MPWIMAGGPAMAARAIGCSYGTRAFPTAIDTVMISRGNAVEVINRV